MASRNPEAPAPAVRELEIETHSSHVVTCLVADDDRIITASDDATIIVHSIHDGALEHELKGHEGGVWALARHGDVLVSGSTDRTVRVWSVARGVQTHVLRGHTSTVRDVKIVEPVRQPDGSLVPPQPLVVTCSRDSTVRVWRLPDEHMPEDLPTHSAPPHFIHSADQPDSPLFVHVLTGHTSAVRALDVCGRFCASAAFDGTVRVWDVVDGSCVHVLEGEPAKVYSVVIDPVRLRVISGSMDASIRVWDLVTGDPLATLKQHHSSLVGLLSLSPSHLLSASADGTVVSSSATTYAVERVFRASPDGGGVAITCLATDGGRVVVGFEGCAVEWDLAEPEDVRDVVVGQAGTWQVGLTRKRIIVACHEGGSTRLHVLARGKEGKSSALAGLSVSRGGPTSTA